MKQIIIIFLIFIASLHVNAQHNSDYVQYMFNGLLLNPAYAGSQDALNITTLYRNQWLGLPGAPVSAIVSAHSPLKNKKLNLGVSLSNERFGVFNHTNANLIYAYRFKLLTGKLALGVQGGVDSYSTNWNKINTTDASDPNFTNSATRKILPQAGAGAYYNSNNFYIGLSVPNLFNGSLNHDMVEILSGGCVLKVNDNVRLKPAMLIKRINASPLSANISTTIYYKEFVGLGIGYTYKSSALAYVDLRLNDQLHFGYGYEYSLNGLQHYTSGSHEIMLRYLFKYKINAINARYF